MKWLMKKIGLSSLDASYYTQLMRDLESLGVVHMDTYTSSFPLFSQTYENLKSEPRNLDDSNHVVIFLDGKKAVQFFKRSWETLGLFSNETFSPSENEKIELMLLKNGFYTGTTAWKYSPWRPLLLISIIFIYMIVGGIHMYEIVYWGKMSTYKILQIVLSILAIFLALLTYRQYFQSK
jgi:hypothetical protein